jgi:hypothetical protein
MEGFDGPLCGFCNCTDDIDHQVGVGQNGDGESFREALPSSGFVLRSHSPDPEKHEARATGFASSMPLQVARIVRL